MTFFKHAVVVVPRSPRPIWMAFLTLCWVLGLVAATKAQNPVPEIWSMYYGNHNYSFSSQTDPNGSITTLHYTTYEGGSADLTWNATTSSLVNVVFTPLAGGSVTYVHAGPNQPDGALSMSGAGANALLSIGGATYSPNDTTPNGPMALIGPLANPEIQTLQYGTQTYSLSQAYSDIVGVENCVLRLIGGGIARVQQTYTILGNGVQTKEITGIQIITPTGLIADYTCSMLTFNWTSGSTGPNALTAINGHQLVNSGNTVTVPKPFNVIIYQDQGYDPISVTWSLGSNIYQYVGMYATDVSWDGNTSFHIDLGAGYEDGTRHGRPGTIYRFDTSTTPDPLFTETYYADGNFLVPMTGAPPASVIQSFQYQGAVYSLTGAGTWNNGVAEYHFHGANGVTATVDMDPNTRAVTSWTIHPSSGATAIYAPGENGSYVLQNLGPTVPNGLNWVNNVAYTITDNISAPPDNASNSGDVIIQGNQLSLGVWTNDFTHAGLTFSYQDGGIGVDSTIGSMSSRSLTEWVWGHPATDSYDAITAMELDDTHALKLYPNPPSVTASGPTATVVLDPNGTSTYSQAVHFDGPVRIKPQGDLSMGVFTVEPTPAP